MPELGQYTRWAIRDTTKEQSDALVTCFGSSTPVGFFSREDAETYLRTCYTPEAAALFEIIHADELWNCSNCEDRGCRQCLPCIGTFYDLSDL
jgi:hypothetical protein